MSYSQSSRYSYLPCSQSHKMSIGMVADSSDKPCSRYMKDIEVLITRADGQASSQEYARQIMKRDKDCIDKQPSTSSHNLRQEQTRDLFHLFPNQTVSQPGTGEKIETHGTISRGEAKKDGVVERCGEFSCGDNREVSRPVKEILHEQPDEMENRCKEKLRTKLQEILGTIPSTEKKYDELVANEVLPAQTYKSDARLKHKQNSDTIETNSEKDDQTVRRSVTRLLARKRVPANSRPVNLKTTSVLHDKMGNHVFSLMVKSVPSKVSEENGSSSTEMFENAKQSCGMKPDELTHYTTDAVNIQQAITEDKTSQHQEEVSLGGRMASPQHGCLRENLEPDAATHNENIHFSIIREKDQLTNVEYSISPEASDHQISLASQSPVNHDNNINSPLFKMAKTVHNSIMSHHFCGFVRGGKAVYQFKCSPAAEDNAGSSDDEDTYTTTPEPSTMENAANGLLSPEEIEFDSSEALPDEEEMTDAKKHVLFHAKRHCSNGVDHINLILSMPSREASANDEDELLEPLEGPEDDFARVVSLLVLALERVKAKMMSVTNNRCSDILMSAAEEIHSQLCNFDFQIQIDLWYSQPVT